MESCHTQSDAGPSAAEPISGNQESGRSCTGACAECREAARQRLLASEKIPELRRDISGRPDLVRLVDTFYQKIRADQKLGHVFDTVAKVHWDNHLPKLYDFWDTVLFRAGTFRGNPIAAHANLVPLTDMGWPLFERWLELFRITVKELFAGERAGHIVRCAEDMAGVIHSKIHGIRDPRHDPARLTPEQQARYASYRNLPARE